jgi:dTDP-6-deoxy-L-talose 4-dehydrogenase (NAD+)
MKSVLVTGATGFIGNYVVQELLQRNYKVIATSTSTEKAMQMNWFHKVKYVEFDICSFSEETNYVNFFHQPEALIHLAWEGLPNYKADFHLVKNLPAHTAFLENLIQNGLKDITVTGTCFEYGMVEGKLSEDMVPAPDNAYASAKDGLRKTMQIVCSAREVSLKWVRLFYMYGKGQHPNALISQLDKALQEGKVEFNMSGGEQQRDFLPVQTVASNIVTIAMQNSVTGIINCCDGKPVMVKDFVVAYLNQQNKHIQLNLGYYPYADYEPMRFWGDNVKLQSILNNPSSK